ncbi:MAG: beta-ketoacyl-ACP reductase [Candidatus Hydrogenedentes bacterium]|nr:beta-ketoacyl-ACP reductase [Candidatus Hydrogenedentota bacterium]
MNRFEDKKVLVTGGTRGIGRACVEAFLAEGARVVFCGRDLERVRQTAGELGERALGLACDVGDAAAVEEMAGEAEEWLGGLDVLVCNSGIARFDFLVRMKDADWDAVQQVNLNGVFYCCRAVSKGMIKRRGGRIVTVSSIMGLHGGSGMTNYSAAKGGIIGFTKAMAQELARRNITANVVAPGYTETDMTSTMTPETVKTLMERIPLGRSAQPAEIAKAVLFLASDDASYITGEVLCVDGGLTM